MERRTQLQYPKSKIGNRKSQISPIIYPPNASFCSENTKNAHVLYFSDIKALNSMYNKDLHKFLYLPKAVSPQKTQYARSLPAVLLAGHTQYEIIYAKRTQFYTQRTNQTRKRCKFYHQKVSVFHQLFSTFTHFLAESAHFSSFFATFY